MASSLRAATMFISGSFLIIVASQANIISVRNSGTAVPAYLERDVSNQVRVNWWNCRAHLILKTKSAVF